MGEHWPKKKGGSWNGQRERNTDSGCGKAMQIFMENYGQRWRGKKGSYKNHGG